MRPRLRDDVRHSPTDDGVYVSGDHGACVLKGAQLSDWLDRLAPHLSGEHTLDQMTSGLTDERRDHVVRLVNALATEGFVVDDADERPHGLTREERDTYAAEIAFVRHRLPSAEHHFERVRTATLALLGCGPVLAALLDAIVVTGGRTILVVAPAPEHDALRAVAERARRDDRQTVRFTTAPGATGSPGDADVLLQVSGDWAELLSVAEARAGLGGDLGQILLGDDEAWVHPVGPARTARSCWRRLAGNPHPDVTDTTDYLTGAVPGLIATRLALSCFSRLTGLAGPDDQRLVRTDLRTLDTRRHRVAPIRPTIPRSADDVRSAVEERAAAEPLSVDALLDLTAERVDPRTGLFASLDEGTFAQSPLSVCAAEVCDPRRERPTPAPAPTAIGWGQDRTTARARAVLAGCATYGALIDRAEFGIDPLTGLTRALPRRPGRAGPQSRPPVGCAAGLTWDHALAAALRRRAEEMIARAARERGGGPSPSYDEPASTSERSAAHPRDLLRAAGETPRVTDLGDVLGIPAYRVTISTASVVSCAPTSASALRDGYERALLAWQAGVERQPAYGAAPQPWWPDDNPPAWRPIAEALRATGRVPLAVPLPHDTGVSPTPHVVRVELCDA